MVSFVKSMPPSLMELKATPSFWFPFKIPDDPTATNSYSYMYMIIHMYLFEQYRVCKSMKGNMEKRME